LIAVSEGVHQNATQPESHSWTKPADDILASIERFWLPYLVNMR
jgi:hypothetical protein